MYKVHSKSTPVYLHRRITERVCWTLCSSAILLQVQPFTRTHFSSCAIRFSARPVLNSLPETVLISDSLPLL